MAFFYLDFSDAEKQRCSSVLRSIIAQLLTQYPETPEPLMNLYKRRYHHRRADETSDATLLSALQKIIRLFGKCYIVFDALDEARPREDMLDLIRQILSWNMPNLHMFLASRREMDVNSTLSPLITTKIEMQKSLVNADVSLYVQKKLECDSRLKKWSPSIKAEINDALTKGADGM